MSETNGDGRPVAVAAIRIHEKYGVGFTRRLCIALDRLAQIETGERFTLSLMEPEGWLDPAEYPPDQVDDWSEPLGWELAGPEGTRYEQRKISRGPRKNQAGWYDRQTNKFMPKDWKPAGERKPREKAPAKGKSAAKGLSQQQANDAWDALLKKTGGKPDASDARVPFPVETNLPYPNSGEAIPPEMLKGVKPVEVPLSGLIAGQKDVHRDEAIHFAQNPDAAGPITIIRVGGKNYVEDGTHRAVGAMLAGRKGVMARVFDYNPKTGKFTPVTAGAKEKAPAQSKATPDQVHDAIKQAMASGKPVGKEDVLALGKAIVGLKVLEVKALRAKLGLTKGSGAKQKLADELVAKVVAGGKKQDKARQGAPGKAPGDPAKKAIGDLVARLAARGKVTQDDTEDALAEIDGGKLGISRQDAAKALGLPEDAGDVDVMRALGLRGAGRHDLADKHVAETHAAAQQTRKDAPAKAEQARRKAEQARQEAEWRAHPSLAPLGDRLKISDVDDPVVQEHLEHLSRVPPKLAAKMADYLHGVYVGAASLTGLDDMGHMKGVRPRGWSEGRTWDDVAGGYDSGARKVIAGTGRHASISLAAHEYGHGVDNALNDASQRADFREMHREIFDRLGPYLQQDGPGGQAGCEETFAECFGAMIVDRNLAVKIYGRDMVDWMDANVMGAG